MKWDGMAPGGELTFLRMRMYNSNCQSVFEILGTGLDIIYVKYDQRSAASETH